MSSYWLYTIVVNVLTNEEGQIFTLTSAFNIIIILLFNYYSIRDICYQYEKRRRTFNFQDWHLFVLVCVRR
jgi:hypothetical protein